MSAQPPPCPLCKGPQVIIAVSKTEAIIRCPKCYDEAMQLGEAPMFAPIDWAAMSPTSQAEWLYASVLSTRRSRWVKFVADLFNARHKLSEDDVTALVAEKNELVRKDWSER